MARRAAARIEWEPGNGDVVLTAWAGTIAVITNPHDEDRRRAIGTPIALSNLGIWPQT